MGVGVGSGRGAEAGKQRGIGSACHWIPSQDLPRPALLFAGTPIPTRDDNPFQYSCLENPWREELGRLQSIGSQRVGHLTMVYIVVKSEQSVWCTAKSQEMVITLERVEVAGVAPGA